MALGKGQGERAGGWHVKACILPLGNSAETILVMFFTKHGYGLHAHQYFKYLKLSSHKNVIKTK